MAKIPYSVPTNEEGINWVIKCVQKMIIIRQKLYEGIGLCDEEEKIAGTIVEKLRRGTWQLTGREWQEKESPGNGSGNKDETNVVLTEEQDGNWVMVKQFRGRGDGLEYSSDVDMLNGDLYNNQPVIGRSKQNNNCGGGGGGVDSNMTKTQIMKPFFESLLHASACLQYAIDQYTYSLYGVEVKYQIALEEELKLEVFESMVSKYPRWNTNVINCNDVVVESVKGATPDWSERMYNEVERAIETSQYLLQQKRATKMFQ
ncbi:16237_t:CDS:2 [Entrophospora sp. SA101]|nr:16237_t:CDS:2 [Entrophospora sp. SA101]